MPRRCCRRVGRNPDHVMFKPAGVPCSELEESLLTVDELEALRLKDLEGLEQSEVAERMGVSQPTVHRMLAEARKKVADALVNGKAIRIGGGNYVLCGRRRRMRHGKDDENRDSER